MISAIRGAARQFKAFRVLSSSPRFFSSSPNLVKLFQSEYQLEKKNYEKPEVIDLFLKHYSEWKLSENKDNSTMIMQKNIENYNVKLEFRYANPEFESMETNDETKVSDSNISADFEIVITPTDSTQGIRLFCSTSSQQDAAAFLIGNVQFFQDETHMHASTAYTGPDFDDLDEELQQSLDEWLSSFGINHEVIDFLVACALDKEQREYIEWLQSFPKYL